MARFDTKRFLITGGTSGIGLATALRIVEEGGEVAVTGHSDDHLEEAGEKLPSGSLVLKNDATDPEEAVRLAEKVKDQMGGIDGAFLNAGYGKFKMADQVDVDFYEQMMQTNVRGPVLQMAQLKPLLKDNGAVLLTSSVAPYLGQPGGAIYGATKASMAAIARSWAAELAEKNIRVNSVAPGPIDTNFISNTGMSEEDQKDFADQIKQQVPLGRFGKAEEVAAVCCFLLSDDASYVTASEYFVDGGIAKR